MLETLYNEFIGFFGIGGIIEMVKKNDYSSLSTWAGIQNLIYPIIPVLLLIEIIRAIIYKRFKIEDYQLSFLVFVLNRFISRFISIAAVGFCIGVFEKWAIFKTDITWYWLLYGYVIWEFAHFVYHFLAHKVRILWCLHSTHHAPQQMNLFVNFAHFFRSSLRRCYSHFHLYCAGRKPAPVVFNYVHRWFMGIVYTCG